MKNYDKDSFNAEERILKAATDVFAEKGYDAAGVEEIARRANVTKPLIYYYFKGKRTILEEIIKRYLEKVVEEKEKYVNSITNLNKETLYESFDERVGIFSENKKVLKVIAMEMLKDTSMDDSILGKVYQMYDIYMPKIVKKGINSEELMDVIIASFFFGTMPTLTLTLFGDKFCEFYNMDKEELDERFFKAMKSLYIDYFIEYFTENKKR